MQATRLEYRFRFILHVLIFALGFWSPWLYLPALATVPDFADKSLWLVATSLLARNGWLSFSAASVALLLFALLLTALGAFFRLWGAGYVGADVVASPTMHGDTMLVDGPYCHTRNPLYLGIMLHTLGIAILMPPSGALFTVLLIVLFDIRLALAEEPFLTARFGQAYLDYKAAVPRFLPSPKGLVPSAGAKPHWLQAVLGELYFPAALLVLATLGWSFNAQPLRQGLLIAFGAWLIARAFLPRTQPQIVSPFTT